MSQIVKKSGEKLKTERVSHGLFRSKFPDPTSNWRIKFGVTNTGEQPGSPVWRPKGALGQYLYYAAKLFQFIDEAADERLITEHLYSSPPLHMRRTLDQFYYWTVVDTAV